MASKKNKAAATKNAISTSMAANFDKVELGSFRANFDGLKGHVEKLAEGKQKTAILEGIEELYFSTVSYMKNITTPVTNA